MKTSRIILIIVLLVVAFLLYRAGSYSVTEAPSLEETTESEMFTGTLTEFNSGCYADAECYAMVDGNHVTIAIGWSQDTVGSVIGTDDGMGGLLDHIGEEVEVYAQPVDENKYTLYGSEEYYIKVE